MPLSRCSLSAKPSCRGSSATTTSLPYEAARTPSSASGRVRGASGFSPSLEYGLIFFRFMNRSALKLVELNHIFSLIPQSTTDRLSYLDLCGGPGGFSEYILSCCRRRQIPVTGFGMSLDIPSNSSAKNFSCGWNAARLSELADVHIDPTDGVAPSSDENSLFFILYGPGKDGDILKEHNRNELVEVVAQHAGGVSLVVADGGFEMQLVDDHESAIFPLLVAQVSCMLRCLKEDGSFVLKLLTSDKVMQDATVPYAFSSASQTTTQALIALTSTLFDRSSLVKPLTSRPSRYAHRFTIAVVSNQALSATWFVWGITRLTHRNHWNSSQKS